MFKFYFCSDKKISTNTDQVAVPVSNRSYDHSYPQIFLISFYKKKIRGLRRTLSLLQNRSRLLHYFSPSHPTHFQTERHLYSKISTAFEVKISGRSYAKLEWYNWNFEGITSIEMKSYVRFLYIGLVYTGSQSFRFGKAYWSVLRPVILPPTEAVLSCQAVC